MKVEKKIYPNNIILDEVTEILSTSRKIILMTKGNSMLPFIRGEKDSVLLEKPDNISVGDIVLANIGTKENHKYVLHRVFSIDSDKITLMGDGNYAQKEYCSKSDLSGKVTSIIRPNGKEIAVTRGQLWRKLLPVRPYLLKAYRILQKLKLI